MWYKSENGSSTKPAALDQSSSRLYVYVRKDFELVPASGEDEQAIPEHWQWLETKISKSDWELYQQIMDHDETIADMGIALTELLEFVIGGE